MVLSDDEAYCLVPLLHQHSLNYHLDKRPNEIVKISSHIIFQILSHSSSTLSPNICYNTPEENVLNVRGGVARLAKLITQGEPAAARSG